MSIHILVALPAEARPLIARFRLRQAVQAGGLRIYRNDAITLAVTGMGRLAAATAVGFLAAGGSASAWLNVGIAGHHQAAVGTPLVAHRIDDQATGQCWFPPLVFTPPCATDTLTTADRPHTDYAVPGLCDMEAAAMVAAAARFAPLELIHSLKVVSDNPVQPAAQVTPQGAEALMEAQREAIAAMVEILEGLAQDHAAAADASPLLAQALARWPLSQYERKRLARALQRGEAVLEDGWQPRFLEQASGKRALTWLEQRLGEAPVRL